MTIKDYNHESFLLGVKHGRNDAQNALLPLHTFESCGLDLRAGGKWEQTERCKALVDAARAIREIEDEDEDA